MVLPFSYRFSRKRQLSRRFFSVGPSVCYSGLSCGLQTALKLKQKMFKEDWAFFKAQRRLLEQTLPKHRQTASSNCHSWYLHCLHCAFCRCFAPRVSSFSICVTTTSVAVAVLTVHYTQSPAFALMTLIIPSTRCTTLGDQAFPVTALLLANEMLFRRLFVLRHHCCSSAATSRRHCFSHRILHHSVQLCDRL